MNKAFKKMLSFLKKMKDSIKKLEKDYEKQGIATTQMINQLDLFESKNMDAYGTGNEDRALLILQNPVN